MSKKRNYKNFIQTLKAYDVYVTFRVLMHKQIEHHGGNPHDKFALRLKQTQNIQNYTDNNWSTKRIVSFLNGVKRIMNNEKYKYFTINNAL
jgi:transposase-like protein